MAKKKAAAEAAPKEGLSRDDAFEVLKELDAARRDRKDHGKTDATNHRMQQAWTRARALVALGRADPASAIITPRPDLSRTTAELSLWRVLMTTEERDWLKDLLIRAQITDIQGKSIIDKLG